MTVPAQSRPINRRKIRPISKQQFQAELNDPGIAACAAGVRNRAEARAGECGVRVREIHLVKDVEHLGPELSADTLDDPVGLEESDIPVV